MSEINHKINQNLWRYTGNTYQHEQDFWKLQLAKLQAPFLLNGNQSCLEVQGHVPSKQIKQIYKLNLDTSVSNEINLISKKNNLGIYTLIVSAISYLLSRYIQQSSIVVDSPLLASNLPTDIDTISEVAIITTIDDQKSLKNYISEFAQTISKTYTYQNFPYKEIIATAETIGYLTTNVVVWFEDIHAQCNQNLNRYDLGIEIQQEPMSIIFHYNSLCFDSLFVQNFASHLQNILSAYSKRDMCIADLDIFSTDEIKKLFDWSKGVEVNRQPQTIYDVFGATVSQTPQNTAIQTPNSSMTYQELDARVNKLAHNLRTQYNIQPQAPIGVILGRSERLIIALLAVLKVGGIYVPIDPDCPSDRLEFIIRDSDVKVLLMEVDSLNHLQNVLDIPMFAMDVQLDKLDLVNSTSVISQPNDLAYILYTSGSTGSPKGVMVEHHSFINMALAQIDAFGIQANDCVLQFANASFDASLSEVFMALFSGATLVMLDKATIGERERFITYLDEQKVTVATLPPAYLRALERPNFKYLRVLITAGEPADVGDACYYAQSLNYFNAYGLTETAVCATYYKVHADFQQEAIPIGQPICNTTVYLLDQLSRPVPVGVIGEICVAGKGLARGYLKNSDLTAAKFVENRTYAFGERLYHTGDFAKRLPSGDLIFLGRQDNQVKVRGYRIELGDIEVAIRNYPQVQQSVVLAKQGNDGNQEINAYITGNKLNISELRAALKKVLPEYMIPVNFILLDTLPLNSNGKIDRHALLELEISNKEEEIILPRTPIEQALAAIWAEVLGVEVSIHDNFFDIGGHSLTATQIISRIRQVLSVELPQRSLFEAPTIAELSKVLETTYPTLLNKSPVIQPILRNEELALSFAQQRLWVLDKLEENAATYNISAGLQLIGKLHVSALNMAVQEIVRRHEILRTTFPMVEAHPVQAVAATQTINILTVDLRSLTNSQQLSEVQRLADIEAQQPFDLATGPLLRVQLLVLAETSHVLLVTMHHIISDGWSISIFINEVAALYKAFYESKPSPLPELTIQYADFAAWQRQWLSGEVLETQLNYWRNQLQGIPPLLELPSDRPRPAVQTFSGNTQSFELDIQLTQKLEYLSQNSGTTLFMTLLAAFVVLLARYSGQQDIVIGSPIANRNRQEIEQLIGFFVNTLVLRSTVDDNSTFSQLLQRVKQTALDAYAHQDLPFEQLVEALQPERSLSYSPLFQVMFVLQNAPSKQLELPGLTLTPIATTRRESKFDLTLAMEQTPTGLIGEWEYNTDLFDATTIQRLTEHFQTLLSGIVVNPEQTVFQLPLLTPSQLQHILVESNQTYTQYSDAECLHRLFEKQVELTPDAVAVVFEDESLTYRQLNQRANQLAHYLQFFGVKPDVLVGICVERSLLMIIGLLAILKASGAYVPLDPAYPIERLTLILEDTSLSVLLTQANLVESFCQYKGHTVYLDDWETISSYNNLNLMNDVVPDLAYVIYTSGSTGKPKGVQISHKSLVNFLNSMREQPGITRNDILLAVTTICFDIAGLEIYLPLIVGAQIVLVSREVATNGDLLLSQLQKSRATVLQATPATWQMLLESGWQGSPQLKILCGGAALSPKLANQLIEKGDQLWNLYGPTETTIWSTICHVQAYQISNSSNVSVTIGKPIANTKTYILDRHLQPVPIGVVGELHIGGAGLAKGYFNRPELTAEKFIRNPIHNNTNNIDNTNDSLKVDYADYIYKTGDLARYLSDGNIEYIGRIDNQVKLRGFRIELGEIEAALNKHPQVKESVVILREDQPGKKRLVAYFVSDVDTVDTVDTNELRNLLYSKIPDYMIPSTFVMLANLPLTANGKINYLALPVPDVSNSSFAITLPRTSTEENLTNIWSQVLGLERVGIYENFFELGGDSIQIIQVVTRAKQVGLQLTPKQLFQYQNIAQLASVVSMTIPTQLEHELEQTTVRSKSLNEKFTPSDFPLANLNEDKLRKILSQLD